MLPETGGYPKVFIAMILRWIMRSKKKENVKTGMKRKEEKKYLNDASLAKPYCICKFKMILIGLLCLGIARRGSPCSGVPALPAQMLSAHPWKLSNFDRRSSNSTPHTRPFRTSDGMNGDYPTT
jgi:hypothetical protein